MTKVSPEGQISKNGTKGQKQGKHALPTRFYDNKNTVFSLQHKETQILLEDENMNCRQKKKRR